MPRSIKKPMLEIKRVLNKWDPIGAEGFKSPKDEYDDFIPMLLKHTSDKEALIEYLEYMLIEKLGLPYDATNMKHKQDVMRVATKIMNIWSVR